MAYKMRSELSEAQIEADISNYLGWISPSVIPFRLIAVNEQLTGADKKLNLAIPIYMQFKVSEGLMPISKFPHTFIPNFLYSHNSKPLNRIREYRRATDLFDRPTLYFKLRRIAIHAEDYQHNVLFKLSNIPKCKAFYVAPLMLKDNEYQMSLFSSFHRPIYPFYHRNIDIYHDNWLSHIGTVPFLRAHISIPPIERVNTDNHYYSFSTSGNDIAWHSKGSLVKEPVYRLGDTIKTILNNAVLNEYFWSTPKELLNSIRNEFNTESLIQFNDNQFPIDQLQSFGEQLFALYGIKQFLLLTEREALSF